MSGSGDDGSEWEHRASRLVRSRLALSGLSQKDLAARLSRAGRKVSAASINSKIARGTFTAAFLLEVLAELGVKTVEVPD